MRHASGDTARWRQSRALRTTCGEDRRVDVVWVVCRKLTLATLDAPAGDLCCAVTRRVPYGLSCLGDSVLVRSFMARGLGWYERKRSTTRSNHSKEFGATKVPFTFTGHVPRDVSSGVRGGAGRRTVSASGARTCSGAHGTRVAPHGGGHGTRPPRRAREQGSVLFHGGPKLSRRTRATEARPVTRVTEPRGESRGTRFDCRYRRTPVAAVHVPVSSVNSPSWIATPWIARTQHGRRTRGAARCARCSESDARRTPHAAQAPRGAHPTRASTGSPRARMAAATCGWWSSVGP